MLLQQQIFTYLMCIFQVIMWSSGGAQVELRWSYTESAHSCLSLTGTRQRVANHTMVNKLALAQSSLTVTTETVETDHMTLGTLEDQDDAPERQTGRRERQVHPQRDFPL